MPRGKASGPSIPLTLRLKKSEVDLLDKIRGDISRQDMMRRILADRRDVR